MNSNPSKLASVVVGLVATWTTAHADTTVTATFTPPASAGTVDHVRIFAESFTNPFPAAGTYIAGSAVAGADFGPVTNPLTATGSLNVAYAAGTSALVGLVGTAGTNKLFFSSNGFNEANANSYFGSGTHFNDAFNAIMAGDATSLMSLYRDSSSGVFLYDFDPGFAGTVNANRSYVLTRGANGSVTSTLSNDALTFGYTPVATPEPAPMAALALGGLALVRRRRRLA